MVIAATCFAAVCCKKADNNDNPNNNQKDPDKPNEEQPAKYTAPIKIDGDFSDWAKLDDSKVATARNSDGSSYEALKIVKVYADEMYVYIYFEWDKELIEHSGDELVPLHIYINGDGDASTGGFADEFEDACMDFMTEGFLFDGNDKVTSYDPGCYKWEGEVNGSGWDDCWVDIDSSSDLFVGAGVEGKYELAMTRELYPLGKLADNFSIGFDIQQSWDSVGILPNSAEGHAASLQVVTVK